MTPHYSRKKKQGKIRIVAMRSTNIIWHIFITYSWSTSTVPRNVPAAGTIAKTLFEHGACPLVVRWKRNPVIF